LLVVALDVIGVIRAEVDNRILAANTVLERFITFVFALLGVFVGIGGSGFVAAVGQKADGREKRGGMENRRQQETSNHKDWSGNKISQYMFEQKLHVCFFLRDNSRQNIKAL